jgi:hypothetical protein
MERRREGWKGCCGLGVVCWVEGRGEDLENVRIYRGLKLAW